MSNVRIRFLTLDLGHWTLDLQANKPVIRVMIADPEPNQTFLRDLSRGPDNEGLHGLTKKTRPF